MLAIEQRAHDFALQFAALRQTDNADENDHDILNHMIEDYYVAVGFFNNVTDEYAKELIRRGESL